MSADWLVGYFPTTLLGPTLHGRSSSGEVGTTAKKASKIPILSARPPTSSVHLLAFSATEARQGGELGSFKALSVLTLDS